MNLAFPDANVEGFGHLTPSDNLPDKNDRHVLACAIASDANLILTLNIKDFPKRELSKYNVEIQRPDEFISNLIDINPALSCNAFYKILNRLKNPTKTKDEILATLRNCGLNESSEKFKNKC